jgi:hypothetical protein
MTSNKRSYDQMQNNNQIEIDSFDGKLDLEKFKEYIEKIKSFQNEAENLIKKRKKEKLNESDDECKNMSIKLKNVKHNIYYNIYHLKKITSMLNDIELDLKYKIEDFCDHDIYSECEYHNDRYYYCKKCTYER